MSKVFGSLSQVAASRVSDTHHPNDFLVRGRIPTLGFSRTQHSRQIRARNQSSSTGLERREELASNFRIFNFYF